MKDMNDAIDKALDALIEDAATIVNEREGKKYIIPDMDIEFSQEHKKKMQKLFKKERQKRTLRIAMGVARRAACVLLVIAAVMSASVFSVEAWRIKFLNFIFDADAPDTEIKFTDEKQGEIYEDMVEFAYMPKGFTLQDNEVSSRHLSLYFTNEDIYFHFTLNELDVNTSVDTEGATVKKIVINGGEGIYISKPDVSILVWHDNDYAYYITSNMEKSEIIKTAENIKIK